MSGTFVWYELTTTDAKAAEEFYKHVIGWDARDAGMPNIRYTLLTWDSVQVAGLVQFPPQACANGESRPGWIGYVGVDDVDAKVEQAKTLGATVQHAAADIPHVGRFAILADPQGAMFAMFSPLMPGQPPAPMTQGRPAWHELHATDWEKAFAFYSSLFGWQKKEALDMGPHGTYQIFGTVDDTRMGMGGIFNKTPEEPAPYWLYYVAVADVDAAAMRIVETGGQVRQGPQQVPGGAWVIQGLDPQNGKFALVGGRTDA